MQVAPPLPWKLFCHFLFFEIKGMVYIINYKHQEGYIQNYLHVNYDVNKVPKTLHRILMTHNKKKHLEPFISNSIEIIFHPLKSFFVCFSPRHSKYSKGNKTHMFLPTIDTFPNLNLILYCTSHYPTYI